MTFLNCVAIDNLPGINNTDSQRLKLLRIKTNFDLLKISSDPQKILHLAQKLQINAKYIRKWIALADLATLPSVGQQYCGLILHAGIISTQVLSQTNAPDLHRKILRLQVANLRRRDLCPSVSLMQTWIKEAKKKSLLIREGKLSTKN